MGLSLKQKLAANKNKNTAVNPPTEPTEPTEPKPAQAQPKRPTPTQTVTQSIERDSNRMVPMPDTSLRYGLHMVVDAVCDRFKL